MSLASTYHVTSSQQRLGRNRRPRAVHLLPQRPLRCAKASAEAAAPAGGFGRGAGEGLLVGGVCFWERHGCRGSTWKVVGYNGGPELQVLTQHERHLLWTVWT